jgi:hypothetical protein
MNRGEIFMHSILRPLIFCLLVACGGTGGDPAELKYYGEDNKEVILNFNTWFEIPLTEFADIDKVLGGTPSGADRDRITAEIDLQILHLFGVFSYHDSPTDFANYSGTIRQTERIKYGVIEKHGDRLRFNYSYSDTAVFYSELLSEDRASTDLKFWLPNSPKSIYSFGFGKNPRIDPKTKKPINTCTSAHDNSEAAFWYYWNPNRKGCPKEIYSQLHLVEARATLAGETESTYPEYNRLFSELKNKKGQTEFSIYFGMDESLTKASDLGRRAFTKFYEGLKNIEVGGQPAFIDRSRSNAKNHMILNYTNTNKDVLIHIRFGNTNSPQFTERVGEWVKKSALFVFSGHSDEGYYFEPSRIFNEKHPLAMDKYQIIFMNSCTSYSYYHSNYFDLKKSARDPLGSKSLDMVTNSIGAPFLGDLQQSEAEDSEGALYGGERVLTLMLLGLDSTGRELKKPASWQQTMQAITNDVGYDFTAMTQVLGDEDNPILPN